MSNLIEIVEFEQCSSFMQALGHSHRAFGAAAQRAQHYAAAATKGVLS